MPRFTLPMTGVAMKSCAYAESSTYARKHTMKSAETGKTNVRNRRLSSWNSGDRCTAS